MASRICVSLVCKGHWSPVTVVEQAPSHLRQLPRWSCGVNAVRRWTGARGLARRAQPRRDAAPARCGGQPPYPTISRAR